jgi:hypothetical protein
MSAPPRPQFKPGTFEEHSWRDYAVRFVIGGIITTLAWLLAHRFGPVVGGLFLAFPAILPASMTLIREHTGKQAALNSALGAAAGSLGLVAFGGVVWLLATRIAPWQVLGAATLAWFVVSAALWTAMEMALGPLRDRDAGETLRTILRSLRRRT